MQWARRRANIAWHKHGIPSWAYRFDVVPNGIKPYVGASHFKEVNQFVDPTTATLAL
jgi:carboxylesterase type B